jgi:hypothetical protein
MREFKFFYGFKDKTLTEQWEEIFREYPTTITEWGNIPTIPTINPPVWQRTTYNPTWVVNPGLIQYTPPNYTQYTPPNYTTYATPGTGTITIPYNGPTHFTSTGTSLTTSNSNGITYTTGGFGGTLTTGTATFNNRNFTTKL